MKIRRIEHIAIAVNDLNESVETFKNVFGIDIEYEEELPEYNTKLAMIKVGETYIEFLCGQTPEARTSQWISKRGTGLYHICFEIDDIDSALAELKEKGVKLRNETPVPGHDGSRIAFIDPSCTDGVLYELVELAKQD